MIMWVGNVDLEDARVRIEMVNWGWVSSAERMEGPRLPEA